LGHNNILKPMVDSRMGLTTIRNGKVVEIDIDTSYRYNSLGYRSVEFGNKNLLVSGCSNTVGIGVPIEGSWGNLLSDELNVEYDNLGILGNSIHLIVKNMFSYFKEFGNPKNVAILFPDIRRIHLPNFNKVLKKDIDFHLPYEYFVMQDSQNNIPKYSKVPHSLSDVFPNEAAMYINLQSILQLEQYCNSLNINLIYTSWDKKTLDIINLLKNRTHYKYFIGEMTNNKTNCHNALKNTFSNHFDYAADVNMPYYEGHFSVHTHKHYADFFLEKIQC
jgi:hypothetical protein